MQNKAGLKFVLCWIGLTFTLGFAWPLVNSLTEKALGGGEKEVASSTSPSTPSQTNTTSVAEEAPKAAAENPMSQPKAAPSVASSNNSPDSSPIPNVAPNNPYAQLMAVQANARKKAQERREASRTEEATSIGKAFENIHQTGEPSEGIQTKRNAYFQKLEEQLKDLQGQNKESPRTRKKKKPDLDEDEFDELSDEIDEPIELDENLDDEELVEELEDDLEDENLESDFEESEDNF